METNNLNQVWPEWHIEKQLGKGTYGTVYKVVRRDDNFTSYAAIKVISIPQDQAEIDTLRSEGLDMAQSKTYLKGVVNDFVNEIKIMQSFKGTQNIVSIEDYKVVPKTDGIGWDIYIRMELLTSFNEYTCDKKLTEPDVIKLGIDICSALELCGSRNIIHRDIKPENIFINDFGYFKLGDFGIARKLENMTGGLSQKGTFNYMAPEVANSAEYDARVDIYSLGIVLYRLLNGNRLPFLDTDKQLLNPNERKYAVERRIRGEALNAPCEASPAMANLILKACAFNPDDRFANASEMKAALMSLQNGTYKIPSVDPDATTPLKNTECVLEATASVRRTNQSSEGTVSVRRAPDSNSNNTCNTIGQHKKSRVPAVIITVLILSVLLGGLFISYPYVVDMFSSSSGETHLDNGKETEEQRNDSADDEQNGNVPTIEPAEFHLGETEIEPGEFVVISAKNIVDPTEITFKSEPDIGFTPTFFMDGQYVRALVPISMEFESSEVDFYCMYGEVTQKLTLAINPKNFGSSSNDISSSIVNQTRTEATIKIFNDTMAPIISNTASTPLWEGTFIEGTDGILRTGFGRYITINSTGETYRHEGCDYVVESEADVMAVNNGKVVYVGYLDLPGYIVVIDHGLGLKSWYAHLSSSGTKVGDTVNKGDIIGKAGSTGFTERTICHITLSVYDVPVCPYDLWDEGIVFGDEDTSEHNQSTEQNNSANSSLSYEMAIAEEEKLMAELEGQLSSLQNASHSQYVGGDFVWPVSMDYTRVTSPYGGRVDPRTGKHETHPGVDIPAYFGESITASNAGTVIAATYHDSYGNYIVIDHGGGYATLYAHCSKLLVSKGDEVEKEQTIAEIGWTGALAYGNLLHFSVFEESKHTDPMKFFK